MSIGNYLLQSADVLKAAAGHIAPGRVETAIEICTRALRDNRALLVCGNGGSAADAMHIAAELVGRFKRDRRALKVISLTCNPSIVTACANDAGFETVFSRQVEAFGEKGGVLIGLSTSGMSANVVKAFSTARALGMETIAFTGQGGGKLAAQASVLLDVPSKSTPLIQQVHVCLYHYLCERIEARLA